MESQSSRDPERPRPLSFTPLVHEIAGPVRIAEWFARLSPLRGVLFLDSARFDPKLGRYSFLTAEPFERIVCRKGSLRVLRQGLRPHTLRNIDPFAWLLARLQDWRTQTIPGLPPFQGGAAGLFSYDLCHHVERLPRPRFDEFATPDMVVGFYDWVIAVDHVEDRAWIISTGLPEHDEARRIARARQRIEAVRQWLDGNDSLPGTRRLQARLARLPPSGLAETHPVPGHPGLLSSFSRSGYLDAVGRCLEYLGAGDIFQVNIAQRLLSPQTVPPEILYGRLRECNPAPFGAYFDAGRHTIASASPERFIKVVEGHAQTRPIKGTRPRGATPGDDLRLREDLQNNPKDRAENVMIVDLLRNDFGRVCRYGSIKVNDPLRIESYEYVHHLVSEVVGTLRPTLHALDLLRAAFPGGSVTGAPKVRAMEIIAELEPHARGAYCGSLGYLGFDGTMDTNILIRTFTVAKGWLQFPVGGGIVADSVPEFEYEETMHKAEGMLRAIAD